MIFFPIYLPWFILLHATGLIALGCSMLIVKPTEDNAEVNMTLGIATVGLGMSYIATSYMPIAEYQFLHVSVPVRILLACLAGLKWLSVARNPQSPKFYKKHSNLLWIFLYDGLGGLVLGWYIDKFNGKVLSHQ